MIQQLSAPEEGALGLFHQLPSLAGDSQGTIELVSCWLLDGPYLISLGHHGITVPLYCLKARLGLWLGFRPSVI